MGVGSSKATLANKELYGTFDLRQNQKFKLNILSDLITMIMGRNNLFDLSELLNTENGCKTLLILLENKMKEEFTTLRFPDPEQRTEKSVASFLPIQQYVKYQDKPVRDALCKEFAFFIVRFTTLMSALVASVAIQRNIATELVNNGSSGPTAAQVKTERIRDIVATGSREERQASSTILFNLQRNGTIQQVSNDTPNLYKFKDNNDVILNAARGVIYLSQMGLAAGVLRGGGPTTTPVLGISFTMRGRALEIPGQYGRLSQAIAGLGAAPVVPYQMDPYAQNPYVLQQLLRDQARLNPALLRPERRNMAVGTNAPMINAAAAAPAAPAVPVVPAVPAVPAAAAPAARRANQPTARGYKGPPDSNELRAPNHSNAASSISGQSAKLNQVINRRVGSSASSVVSGRSRRKVKSARRRPKTRKQRGGEDLVFDVQVYQLVGCPQGNCILSRFIMDSKGMTWSESEFMARGIGNVGIPFIDRVKPLLKAQPQQNWVGMIDLPQALAPQTDLFDTFSKFDSETYQEFRYIKDSIIGINTENRSLTSPAVYRALLLATGVTDLSGVPTLETMFCRDAWVGKMTANVPYALLNALYFNEINQQKNEKAKNELNNVCTQFLQMRIAKQNESSKRESMRTPALTLSNLDFVAPNELASEFCKERPGPFARTDNEAQRTLLTKAHKDLRDAYDIHLQSVIEFIKRMITLRDMGFRNPYMIRLNEQFVKNPSGSIDVLEAFITEGRTLIAKHYILVESIYKRAILNLPSIPTSPIKPVVSTESNTDKKLEEDTNPQFSREYKSSV